MHIHKMKRQGCCRTRSHRDVLSGSFGVQCGDCLERKEFASPNTFGQELALCRFSVQKQPCSSDSNSHCFKTSSIRQHSRLSRSLQGQPISSLCCQSTFGTQINHRAKLRTSRFELLQVFQILQDTSTWEPCDRCQRLIDGLHQTQYPCEAVYNFVII